MYWEVGGVYVYDAAKIGTAHEWCLASAKIALEQGENVVVSNTFAKLYGLKLYIDLGFPYRIIEAKGKWESIHSVPDTAIEIMEKDWETLPPGWLPFV